MTTASETLRRGAPSRVRPRSRVLVARLPLFALLAFAGGLAVPAAAPAEPSAEPFATETSLAGARRVETRPAEAAAPEVTGTVTDPDGRAIAGADVALLDTSGAAVAEGRTGAGGRFRLAAPALGSYVLRADAPGFEPLRQPLDVAASGAEASLRLELAAVTGTVEVTAGSPDLGTELRIPARELERPGALDLAEALRGEPGIDAVRRGPINLEPTVRGLQEQQVAMLVDGTRTFAAGPGRMDSDLSHVGLHAVETVRVVKGPYALTWGAGAMSAVELVTVAPEFRSGPMSWRGRAGLGLGENGSTADGHLSLLGSSERLRLVLSGGWREGDDYQAGDGSEVPAGFESGELRWRLGWRSESGLRLGYSGGYQDQRDVDYPGRQLDATYFYTRSHALEAAKERPGRAFEEVYGQLYVNRKDHRMNNDGKPSARPMPGRMPPFALAVDLPTESNTTGARGRVRLVRGDWRVQAGGDWYRVEQDAVRRISRRDDGVLLFEDRAWPDAEIEDLGLYLQAVRSFGGAEVGATLRGDRVDATAAEPSELFLAHTTGAIDREDSHVSAAVSARWRAGERWVLSAGAGRAVRAPSAIERYSDRFPSTRFQVSAELLGDPGLDPERSLEVDAGAEYAAGGFSFSADVFWREIDDYITVVPDPSVPKRLPMSPPTVYRYVNGDRAVYRGGELVLRHAPSAIVSWRASASYTRAEDEGIGEPVLGIPPLTGRAGITLRTPGGRWWGDLGITAADRQDRVATSRFEIETPGWTRWDLRAGVALPRELALEVGVGNLLDESYATHLDARNPFTGARILEPGRSVFGRLSWHL